MTLANAKCEACGSDLVSAAPIGLYCHNKACTHEFDMAASAMKAMRRRQALAAALEVPEVKALMEAARDRVHFWVNELHCTCGACEPLIAAIRAMEGRDG